MKRRVCFIIGLCLLLVIIGGVTYFSKNVQKIFVYSQELEPADVVLILGGWDSKYRVEHGVDLYKKGYAPKILMSEGYTIGEFKAIDMMKDYAQKLGVPPEDILIEKESESTVENAIMVKRILEELLAQKIILVTADYHSKRSARIFSDVLGPDYKIINSPAIVYNQKDWKNWWKEEKLRSYLLMETFKYAYYLFFSQ